MCGVKEMRCTKPVRILEVLRLTELGYSQRKIAESVKCGKSTVGDIQKRCRDCNLKFQDAINMMK